MNYLANLLIVTLSMSLLLFGYFMLILSQVKNEMISIWGNTNDMFLILGASSIGVGFLYGLFVAFGLVYTPGIRKGLIKKYPEKQLPDSPVPLNLWKNPMQWGKTFLFIFFAFLLAYGTLYGINILLPNLQEMQFMMIQIFTALFLPFFLVMQFVTLPWYKKQMK